MNTIQPIQHPQPITIQPINEPYNAKKNELENKVEAEVKNTKQDNLEEQQNHTPSLNDMQTLRVQSEVTQNKIEAYKAGAGIDSDNKEIQSINARQDYQEIQEISKQQNGIKEYQKQSLLG